MAANTSEKKILIVEDEQIIAHSIERSLTRAGYVVPALASSAQEAYEQIELTQPDLVLMDIHIQGPTDGVDTAKAIRERYRLPVIYLTAHADAATLERAKEAEPLGYLVKPLNHTNLPSSIEMALYKHKMNRQLEDQRAILETILESMAEAVLVTDADGRIEFLNRAAEELTGWPQAEAEGKVFEALLSMSGSAGLLLSQCLSERKTLPVMRETAIRTRQGATIFVDGQISVSRAEDRTSGAMITLHDATQRRQEEHQIRQEQKLLSTAQLANDIATDFCGLFDLSASCSEELLLPGVSEGTIEHSATIIQQASNAGAGMARQLLQFGRNRDARSSPVNLNQLIERNVLLYQRLCGTQVEIETRLSADLEYILSHEPQLEQLTLSLVMGAKHALVQAGKIILSTSNAAGTEDGGVSGRKFVRLAVSAETHSDSIRTQRTPALPIRNPEVTLAIVNAIVTVAEGSIRSSYESEALSITEVFLPAMTEQQRSGKPAAAAEGQRRSVLTIGMPADWGRQLHAELERNGLTVLESGNAQEALLVSELYQESIDLIIVEGSSVPAFSQRRIFGVVSSRWPDVRLLTLCAQAPHASIPKATVLLKPYKVEDVINAAKRAISLRVVRAK